MEKNIRKVIGHSNGLQFEFEISGREERKWLAWGKGILRIKGEPLWVTEAGNGGDQSIEWSWLDLLEFLADFWPWLMLEEIYPISVNPLDVTRLEEAAERRWEELSDEIVDAEDEELVLFRHRHDLAMAMKGIYLPTILLLRQGRLFQVGIPEWNQAMLLPFLDVNTVLEEVGNFIASIVLESDIPRAMEAVFLWEQRESRMQQQGLRLRSGLNTEDIAQIQAEEEPAFFWEYSSETGQDDSELLAAARMTPGELGVDGKREIIEAVRSLPSVDTPDLDALAEVAILIELDTDSRPFEQGYVLASWLRGRLDMKRDAVANPEKILNLWGVVVQDMSLIHAGESFDAIAAWGNRHGPAVLINTSPGAIALHEHRRRTSLAHEICHLLIDRNGALPLIEVLGGRTPEMVEQRARAFAAEFLLPRSVAADLVRTESDLEKTVAELSEKYCLSQELVAWQITNSEIYHFLNAQQRGRMERMRGVSINSINSCPR